MEIEDKVYPIPRESIIDGSYLHPLMQDFNAKLFAAMGSKGKGFETKDMGLDTIHRFESDRLQILLKKIRVNLNGGKNGHSGQMKFEFAEPIPKGIPKEELPKQIWWANISSVLEDGMIMKQSLSWEWGNLGETRPPEGYSMSYIKNLDGHNYLGAIGVHAPYSMAQHRIPHPSGLALDGLVINLYPRRYEMSKPGGDIAEGEIISIHYTPRHDQKLGYVYWITHIRSYNLERDTPKYDEDGDAISGPTDGSFLLHLMLAGCKGKPIPDDVKIPQKLAYRLGYQEYGLVDRKGNSMWLPFYACDVSRESEMRDFEEFFDMRIPRVLVSEMTEMSNKKLVPFIRPQIIAAGQSYDWQIPLLASHEGYLKVMLMEADKRLN